MKGNIQGLTSLNVGILPSCRGPHIKKNSVNFFANSHFFLQYFEIFLILMCVLKYIVSHTITRLYTIFLSMTLIQKKHDPKVIEKNFDNKKGVHILSKYNKEEIIKIHHCSPEIFKFL